MRGSQPRLHGMRTWTGRFLFLCLIWWILSEGDAAGIYFGAVAAALVAWWSVALFPAGHYSLSWRAVPGFAVFFLAESVVAGLDVAGRILRPSLPIDPDEITLDLRLPVGAPRWLLANTLSLLPGTLSVVLHQQQLVLHCLDHNAAITASVRKAETRIAALFGLALRELPS